MGLKNFLKKSLRRAASLREFLKDFKGFSIELEPVDPPEESLSQDPDLLEEISIKERDKDLSSVVRAFLVQIEESDFNKNPDKNFLIEIKDISDIVPYNVVISKEDSHFYGTIYPMNLEEVGPVEKFYRHKNPDQVFLSCLLYLIEKVPKEILH